MENWINISVKELEKYQISNLGRIRNKKTSKILKFCVNRYGYLFFRVSISTNTKKNYYVHRLVLSSFTESNDSLEVNHINHNPKDNRLVNLEWVTRQANIDKKRENLKEQIKYLYESKDYQDIKDFYEKIILL